VTSDAAALCIKSGNPVVLKGGREALRSNGAIAAAVRRACLEAGGESLADAVCLVDVTDRRAVAELVRMDDAIDLAIPRGGRGLIDAVVEAARVPVVKHDAGICHVYIDGELTGMEAAAIEIAFNAKMQRTGVCNACETLLVHERSAEAVLPGLGEMLVAAGCEVRGDARTRELVPLAVPASEADWGAEYLAPILAVRVVGSLDEAVAHIARHGSEHTEAIVTASQANAERFAASVTSANVMINCSTRFADGGVYGLGAEIGISTDKLHARGPMGARDLTTYQWVLTGTGQIRR
jgi:glutamate-5-semialdehyde dehydrogenase